MLVFHVKLGRSTGSNLSLTGDSLRICPSVNRSEFRVSRDFQNKSLAVIEVLNSLALTYLAKICNIWHLCHKSTVWDCFITTGVLRHSKNKINCITYINLLRKETPDENEQWLLSPLCLCTTLFKNQNQGQIFRFPTPLSSSLTNGLSNMSTPHPSLPSFPVISFKKNAPKNPNIISLCRTDHRETGKTINDLIVLCRRGAFYQTNVLIRLNDNKVFLGHLGPPEGLGPPEHCQLCFVRNPTFV